MYQDRENNYIGALFWLSLQAPHGRKLFFPLRRAAGEGPLLHCSLLLHLKYQGEARNDPSLPLLIRKMGSPRCQRHRRTSWQGRWLPSLSAERRCLDVLVQCWHWVWLLLQLCARKHCRSLIKLSIRQWDIRLICFTHAFKRFSFAWGFPFAQWNRVLLFECILNDWGGQWYFGVFHGTFHCGMPWSSPVKQVLWGCHHWGQVHWSLAVSDLKTAALKSRAWICGWKHLSTYSS